MSVAERLSSPPGVEERHFWEKQSATKKFKAKLSEYLICRFRGCELKLARYPFCKHCLRYSGLQIVGSKDEKP
jgi:hypothetical protein